jgi:hypothetical protein
MSIANGKIGETGVERSYRVNKYFTLPDHVSKEINRVSSNFTCFLEG